MSTDAFVVEGNKRIVCQTAESSVWVLRGNVLLFTFSPSVLFFSRYFLVFHVIWNISARLHRKLEDFIDALGKRGTRV